MKLKKIVAPVKLWKRIVAYLIDVIIVNLIIVYPFRDFFGNFENDIIVKEIGPEIFMVFFIISILTILYWALLEFFLKQSIGKALLNIYVRSTEKELKFWQCIVRNLSKINTLLLIIDSLNIIFRKDYQRYLEKISNTEVVDGE
ncbi:RDD family protein [Candidatus Woesearchaeota archaeon]|nr:RDD family protein [Candidatus Woesearchaeota archaeon]